MSLGYRAVGWNRQKRVYDLLVLAGVVLYLILFLGVGGLTNPHATIETLLIRAFGSAAFLLLHVVLSIGPLARMDTRFLPWLYNRRHLGVITFLLGLLHGLFALFQFHALGNLNPLVSLFVSSARYDSLAWFPFQPLGFCALIVLFLMAATSHDFWLKNLTPAVWKALHMGVYLAYGLLCLHVLLGAALAQSSPLLAVVVATGMVWILALHLLSGWRERGLDRECAGSSTASEVDCGTVEEIPEGRARIVTLNGERVAIFRYDGLVSAVSNVCRHQGGPLGEGRVLDGCITCPWHGYQYQPENGTSPPPFDEKVETYSVRVVDGRVRVDPRAHPPGTPVEPARWSGEGNGARSEEQR